MSLIFENSLDNPDGLGAAAVSEADNVEQRADEMSGPRVVRDIMLAALNNAELAVLDHLYGFVAGGHLEIQAACEKLKISKDELIALRDSALAKLSSYPYKDGLERYLDLDF